MIVPSRILDRPQKPDGLLVQVLDLFNQRFLDLQIRPSSVSDPTDIRSVNSESLRNACVHASIAGENIRDCRFRSVRSWFRRRSHMSMMICRKQQRERASSGMAQFGAPQVRRLIRPARQVKHWLPPRKACCWRIPKCKACKNKTLEVELTPQKCLAGTLRAECGSARGPCYWARNKDSKFKTASWVPCLDGHG